MAKITVHASYGLDVRELDFSSIYYGYSYTRTNSLFRADYGSGYADEFRGSGFKYNSYGEPTAGTVTSYAAFAGGTRAFIVDGFSISATSIVKAANTYSTSDDMSVIASGLKGSDSFTGGNATDYVKLYAGNDTLLGNGGDDFLFAGSGNDKINGGLGRDRLYGESGADTFIFTSFKHSTASPTSRDTIYDFTSEDVIHLATIDANTKLTGNQAFSFIGTNAFTGKAGQLMYKKMSSDTYIFADLNGDKKADFSIHLDDAITLRAGDFIL
ncbi:calcium-binding protein [Mycoplana ramosa]|uniref:Calcium-binding protein n=1 Tax=Mycoplana ramosa TaxID=40837 RepID=A0ABW3YWL8_MYCRA